MAEIPALSRRDFLSTGAKLGAVVAAAPYVSRAADVGAAKGAPTAQRVTPAEVDFEAGETITIKEGSLAGLPGMSVPAGFGEHGLPVGLQLIGRSFDEESVLRSAAALEKAAAFTGRAAGY